MENSRLGSDDMVRQDHGGTIICRETRYTHRETSREGEPMGGMRSGTADIIPHLAHGVCAATAFDAYSGRSNA